MTSARVVICPYCGETQPAGDQCRACRGLFEPLSRQATHNEMGPWYVRDPNRPFQPGCSYETLLKLIDRKIVTRYTIVRGPTTRQFWTIARRVPGIAHLFGVCHHCDASVDPEDHGCHACGAPFGAYLDRNYLGLPEVRPLPWEPDGDDAPMREGDQGSWGWINQPTGLSSFATNAELFGTAHGAGVGDGAADRDAGDDAGEAAQRFDTPGGRAHTPEAGRAALSEHAPRHASHGSGGRAGTMTAQDPAPTELATDDDRRLRSAEVRVRTLQQHAARQARLTRLLAVLTIALAIGLVVFVVLFLRAAGGDGTMSATHPDATPNASSSPSPDDRAGPPAVLDPDADADAAPVDPDATLLPGGGDEESDAAPGRDPDDPSTAPSADESLADDLDLAAQQINRASQAALPFAERAELIESALSILAAALDVADDDAAQSRIEALIERAEAEQARLEVKALLGDPQ